MTMPGKPREIRNGKLRCSRCPPGVWKEFNEFDDDVRTFFGKRTYCKKCNAEYNKKYSKKAKTKIAVVKIAMDKPEIQDLLYGVSQQDLNLTLMCRPWNRSLNLEVG